MNRKLHAQKAPINFNLVRVNWQRKNYEAKKEKHLQGLLKVRRFILA